MPTYDLKCTACDHEWEDLLKMSDPVPTDCPNCEAKGNVKKLISAVYGKVELSGAERKAKVQEDAKKMVRKAGNKENYLANLVGETKYEQNVQLSDKLKKEKFD